jgi:serine/threonine protein kinase
MTFELNRLLVALRESHVLSDAEFEAVQDSLPDSEDASAAGRLLRDLVQAKKLTSYQAKRLAGGMTLVLGEYVIEELLGEGGMGKVFKATHSRLGRPTALKVIHEKYLHSDPQSAARFVREGRAIARLKHTNIVTAYDASVQDGVHFLAMEYIEGVTLGQLVAIGGPLSIDQTLDYLTQAAEALECAHRHGVVHRDIKPTNLMVERSTHQIKVLDLGVARLASEKLHDAYAEDLTATGEIMGTFDYMAPEQAHDAKLVDHRADIYSLGCTLYLMITGKKIYEHATTVFEKARAHREDPIPGLGKYRANVPDAVADLYEQMVKKDPDERVQTMAEIINRARQIRATLFRDGAPTVTLKSSQAIGAAVPDEADPGAAIPDAVVPGEKAKPSTVKPGSKVRLGKFVPAAVLLAALVIAAIVLGDHFARTRDMPGVQSDSPPPSLHGGGTDDPADPAATEVPKTGSDLVQAQAAAVSDRLALLEFVLENRRAIEGVITSGFVAEIRVIRDRELPKMETIDIAVVDENLRDVVTSAKAVELIRLDLGNTNIVDADLARLAKVTELEWLSLFKCELLTDEAFGPLQGLVNLHSIDLRGTMLSGEGLRRLPDAPLTELMVDGFHRRLDGDAIVEVAKRYQATLDRLSAQGVPLEDLHVQQLGTLLQTTKLDILIQ